MTILNNAIFIFSFIYIKFFTQSRQISRILTSALMNFAKRFPKPFIDGVLVPCAVAKKLGKYIFFSILIFNIKETLIIIYNGVLF